MVGGLGNPGREHAGTRHDLGAALVTRLAVDLGLAFRREADADVAGPVRIGPSAALLVKPRLYMNRSGPALAMRLASAALPPWRLLVACDDVHLALGRIRLRREGSAGGHNGLRSVIAAVGEGFPRLRLGVGREPPGMDRADWVLSRFEAEDLPAVDGLLEDGVRVLRAVLEAGVESALMAKRGGA